MTTSDTAQAAIDEHTVTAITDRAFRDEISDAFRASIAASKAKYGPHRTTRPVRLEFNGVKHPIELEIDYVFHPDGKPSVEILGAFFLGEWDFFQLLGKPLLDALAADILRECK